MRVLAFIPFAMLCVGAAAPQRANRAPEAPPADTPPALDRMNVMPGQPGCISIPRQVAGEDRRYDGTRLDQQPPGRLILAVERHFKGCPEVTVANGQERSVRPVFPDAK